jgi:glycosyltransferase involved in cell wall biosynthesis
LYITYMLSNARNTTRYQRILCLSQEFDLVVFLLNSPVPSGLNKECMFYICPFGNRKLWGKLLFPFWCIWKSIWLRKKGYSLIITSYQPFPLISGFLMRLLSMGKKWVADIYDVPEIQLDTMKKDRSMIFFLKNLYYFILSLILKSIINKSDLVLCTLLPEALQKYRIPEEKLVCLTNGTDLDLIESIEQNDHHSISKLPSKYFSIIYVGFMLKSRGIETILEAAEILREEYADIRWTLIGPSKKNEQACIENSIVSKGLEEIVDWKGEITHDQTLLNIMNSDICLYPFPRSFATDYIFPIKIFEYMALGKPLIATRLKGVQKILKDLDNAVFIEPGDPIALANAVELLRNDEQLRQKIGHRAKQKVKEYHWDLINNQLVTSLRQTIST